MIGAEAAALVRHAKPLLLEMAAFNVSSAWVTIIDRKPSSIGRGTAQSTRACLWVQKWGN